MVTNKYIHLNHNSDLNAKQKKRETVKKHYSIVKIDVQRESMNESRSVVLKMLRNKAPEDRQINVFPPPYNSDATPYKQREFSGEVIQSCKSNKQIMAGLKISKAVFLGDVAVGKTSLINRFCHQVFDSNYKATIGVDFEVERFDILQVPYNMQIWDTAGQERFKCIAASYYRGAHVLVIVFDLTNMKSLAHCSAWLKEALSVNAGDLHIFLVGTKRDLMSRGAFTEVGKSAVKVAEQLHAEFWAVSSKTGDCVTDLFNRIAALSFDLSVKKEKQITTEVLNIGSDTVILNKTFNKMPVKPKPLCSGCKI